MNLRRYLRVLQIQYLYCIMVIYIYEIIESNLNRYKIIYINFQFKNIRTG
jgi:hypothetical protein